MRLLQIPNFKDPSVEQRQLRMMKSPDEDVISDPDSKFSKYHPKDLLLHKFYFKVNITESDFSIFSFKILNLRFLSFIASMEEIKNGRKSRKSSRKSASLDFLCPKLPMKFRTEPINLFETANTNVNLVTREFIREKKLRPVKKGSEKQIVGRGIKMSKFSSPSSALFIQNNAWSKKNLKRNSTGYLTSGFASKKTNQKNLKLKVCEGSVGLMS